MSPITTHVLDVSTGRPAAGIGVRLERRAELHKLQWAPTPHATAAGVELETLLTRITHLIDQILRCEHDTDLWILQGPARSEVGS